VNNERVPCELRVRDPWKLRKIQVSVTKYGTAD